MDRRWCACPGVESQFQQVFSSKSHNTMLHPVKPYHKVCPESLPCNAGSSDDDTFYDRTTKAKPGAGGGAKKGKAGGGAKQEVGRGGRYSRLVAHLPVLDAAALCSDATPLASPLPHPLLRATLLLGACCVRRKEAVWQAAQRLQCTKCPVCLGS